MSTWDQTVRRYEGLNVGPVERPLLLKIAGRCWSTARIAFEGWKECATRSSRIEQLLRRQLMRTLTDSAARIGQTECRKIVVRTIKRRKPQGKPLGLALVSTTEKIEKLRERLCPFETVSLFNSWLKPCVGCHEKPRAARFNPCGCHLLCHDCVAAVQPTVCPKCEKGIDGFSAPKGRSGLRSFHRIGNEIATACNHIRDGLNDGSALASPQVLEGSSSDSASGDAMDASDDGQPVRMHLLSW